MPFNFLDLQTRLLDTSEKLHQNRTDEMKSLMEKQAQERAQFLHKADAATSTAELVDVSLKRNVFLTDI